MPTVRGWALIGAGLALALLWLLLGDAELLLTGVFLTGSGLIAVAWVRWAGLSLTAERRLSPAAVHDGDSASASISIRNRGNRRLVQLQVEDRVQGLGTARFDISGLAPNMTATGTYRVTCRPRGVYRVGPATVTSTDPLGLAELIATAGLEDRLVVYPAVEELAGLPTLPGHHTLSASSQPDRIHKGGEDFYTLRPYQRGDDLRRVHWPWSAKTDELMIRQLETPRQARAMVFLDTRETAYESSEAFERAVIGAASVFTHFRKTGLIAEFWSGGPDGTGESDYPAAMERLAVIRQRHHTAIAPVSDQLKSVEGDGALAIVTGQPDREALALTRRLSSGQTAALLLAASAGTPQLLPEFHRDGTSTIVVGPGESWADGWRKAVQGSWDVFSAS